MTGAMTGRAGLILANRAYRDHNAPPGGSEVAPESDGGLLAAVRPVIAPWDGSSGTTWIGVGRGRYDELWSDERGYELIPVSEGVLRHRRLTFDAQTWERHYGAVANSFFWPLLHLSRLPLPLLSSYYPHPLTPSADEWEAYVSVNEHFARAAAEEASSQTCWVHDYQLALVPRFLRGLGTRLHVGFFLHTPFPSLGIARSVLDSAGLARLTDFVDGVLAADVVGLQTAGDVARFRAAAVELLGASETPEGVRLGGRQVRVGAYPVGIDVEEVLGIARTAELPEEARGLIRPGEPLVIGLERADYTKGIPERLNVIADAYDAGLHFSYVGIAAPTRQNVAGYDDLMVAIEASSARAAGSAQRAGCHFLQMRESIPWEGVVALQREADVVFTSSLADGMNLVPIQSAAAQSLRPAEKRAVVIVGRDAGFSSAYCAPQGESDGFATVDALDADSMRETFAAALNGLPERVSNDLIARVEEGDARAWATRFLNDLEKTKC